MKKEVKPFSWIVKNFDCNAQKIKDYDILKYREDDIKKLKKKCATKEEFAEALRRECMYRFWSKAEWELIIECTEDSRVILRPWCGCYNPDEVKIDVLIGKVLRRNILGNRFLRIKLRLMHGTKLSTDGMSL